LARPTVSFGLEPVKGREGSPAPRQRALPPVLRDGGFAKQAALFMAGGA